MSKELEDRFFEFARRVRDFCRQLKWDIINVEYVKQLIKLSGSVAGNFLVYDDKNLEEERIFLLDEAEQIKKILSTIINKLK